MFDTFTKFGLMGLGLLAAVSAVPDRSYAGAYSVLYQFKGAGHNDGSLPFSSLIRDSSGNLYGTTAEGGNGINDGTVFKVTPSGTESVLHAFTGCSDFKDGCQPRGKLLLDKQGNLYGTTYNGGPNLGGTVFKVAPDGTETVLYSFTGNADGSLPDAGLVNDSSGNLYGTGEAAGNGGQGVVFKLDPKGNETVLYSFTGGSDGGTPAGGLLKDSSGNFYGTTFFGGALGNGVVFKVDPSGNETVLYSFQGGNDGANPHAGVIKDSAGNFYGNTEEGGVSNCGTVFKLAPNGTESVLYTFTCGADGGYPTSDLLEINGNFFGTTTAYGGGSCNCGTVFKVTSSGSETVLHAFAGLNDGNQPFGGLLKIRKHLYGTASQGGDPQNDGVVFKVEK